MNRKIALLAVGGNALLREGEWGHQEDQLANARETAEMLARVVAEGYALCVVHGNGPQVGNLLIQQEAASGQIPPYTLDICGAMTQGSMGYMLERMLINRLRFMGHAAPVTSVLTEVVVDKEDPGFQEANLKHGINGCAARGVSIFCLCAHTSLSHSRLRCARTTRCRNASAGFYCCCFCRAWLIVFSLSFSF